MVSCPLNVFLAPKIDGLKRVQLVDLGLLFPGLQALSNRFFFLSAGHWGNICWLFIVGIGATFAFSRSPQGWPNLKRTSRRHLASPLRTLNIYSGFHLGLLGNCSIGTAEFAVAYASLSHFFMKLAFAAPASGLPFLSTAFGSQASFVHLVMKLLSAAPARGLPSFPTALIEQVS
jgi:hypothetical protein